MSILNKIDNHIMNRDLTNEVLYKKWGVNFRDKVFERIYWDFFPITGKYFFEGNPSFFYEYKDMFDMGRYPLIMLRDGFLGILDLFLLHPKPPEDFCSTIMIPKKYEMLVPKGWKDRVALYTVSPRKKMKSTKNEDLVIYGISSEELYWKIEEEDIFKDVAKRAGDFKYINCVFPTREIILSGKKVFKDPYNARLLKVLYKNFGDNIRMFDDLGKFVQFFKNDEFGFYNLDQSQILVADSFVDHYFYTQGGIDLKMENTVIEKPENALEYNLSINHKVIIEELDISKSKFEQFFIKYRTAGRKTNSIYEVFQEENMQELFKANF